MLEKIRNQVAKDSAFDDWDDLCFCHGEMESIKRFEELTKFCDEVAQRYAQSQTQELQEQNAELVVMLEKFKEEIIKAYNQGKQDFARYDPERHGNDLPDGESYYRTKHNQLNKK